MRKRSITSRLIIPILMILAPLLLSVLLNGFYIASFLRGQAYSSSQDIVELYIHQIDVSLAESYLLLVTQSSNTAQLMGLNSSDGVERLYTNIALFNNFRDLLNLYPAIDTIFAYTPKYNEIISASSEKVSYSEKKLLWNYIESLSAKREAVDINWVLVPINENRYFVNIKSFSGGYMGIVTKPETLKETLTQDYVDSSRLIFADQVGDPLTDIEMVRELQLDLSGDLSNYYMSGNKESHMIAGKESSVTDFRLLMAIPDSEIMRKVSWVYTQSYILIAVSVLAFAGVILSICKGVLLPTKRIIESIRSLERGDIPYGIPSRREAKEYAEIYSALNKMLKQIETLKIDKYEEYIKRQQSELHFYQMQIKPHFILGCLTTISSLAKLGEKEKLTAFISDFSSFSRYLFHTRFTLTSLRDELNQIEHFINMQKIRFPDKIFLMTDVDYNCYSRQIPAMILQTLVENCIKHGMDPSADLCILIQCREVRSCPDENEGLFLIVEDTGCGFPNELLSVINTPSLVSGKDLDLEQDTEQEHNPEQELDQGQGQGFGLRNVRAILEFNYNGRACIHFKNIEPRGARVEIKLP
ncbi:MAG: histidine kinase [Oscillospiraceae bacterium]|nr:histidine kinase [Oscillospiraceae bacterium]